ncbi:MAG TPA: hypothetical protein VN688_23145 [Gemmataceae bacterium]|nr:hypothetical protein [Gemmataceae bacterium]
MKYLLGVLFVALGMLGVAPVAHAGKADKGEKKVDSRVFELRTY